MKFLFMLIIFFYNCQAGRNFTPTKKIYNSKFQNKTIMILPTIDLRLNPIKIEDRTELLIPFYFYKKFEKTISILKYEDLNYSLAKQLKYSKLFDNSFIGENVEDEKFDYKIQMKIHNTDLKTYLSYYGLSYYGMLLALTGIFPIQKSYLEMYLEFFLYDKNNNLILRKNYFSKTDYFDNYYSETHNTPSFEKAHRESLNPILSKNYNLFIEEIEKLDL